MNFKDSSFGAREGRTRSADDLPLGLHHPHEPHQVARVVQRDRKVVAGRIEPQPAADHDVPEEGQRALARDGQVGRQQAVGDDRQGLVRVAALPHHDALHLQLLGRLDVEDERARELHVVQPKIVVVMGQDARSCLNAVRFPLAVEVEDRPGEIQRFTPTIDALLTPDVDASLDEARSKRTFWEAFKALGPWWSELPPY